MIQIAPLHTAEEMRSISDLAHRVEGVVLALAALVAFTQAASRTAAGWAPLVWPSLVLAAGVFLLGYLLLPHHGLERAGDQWAFVFGDPQQRQHVIVALLATLGGAAEVLNRTGRARGAAWPLVWPAAVTLVGALLAVHRQHGAGDAVARAVLVHRILGVLLIATGLLRAVEVRSAPVVRWLAFPWTLTLLASALLLVFYREPAGAFVTEHGAAHGARVPPSRLAP